MSKPPHTSMDVGEIHIEGHWKRSPENDEAVAELARLTSQRMKGRQCASCARLDPQSTPHKVPYGGSGDWCFCEERV